MSELLRFDGRVVVITGAGSGLGRSHALAFASRGASVVVNDLGTSLTGRGASTAAADAVVEEITRAGGEAVASYDSVEDGERIVETAIRAFGGVDLVINNAGVLRDTSFQNLSQDDWDLVYRVHLLGAYRVTHAAWSRMRQNGYGRVIFTASAAGLYGNVGQANYSMAKLGVHGLSQTLSLEGRKRNILVNTIAPVVGSRMTETVLPKPVADALKPELVTPLVLWLCHERCLETGGLFEVGGGFMGKLRWQRAEGKLFPGCAAVTPEEVRASWDAISGFDHVTYPADVATSLRPMLKNASAPAAGGRNLIDVEEALAYEGPPVSSSYQERDLTIYALAVGAADNPLDRRDLRFVYDRHDEGFLALPTYAVTPPLGMMMDDVRRGARTPGLSYGFDRMLHVEHYLELKRPLPRRACLTHRARIKNVYDTGRHAIVVRAISTADDTGEELFYNEFTLLIRGAGGSGAPPRPPARSDRSPDREPDAVVVQKTAANQALLYRLSGDWNPLHADPAFAKSFGFDRPILHGLCTLGYAARHVIEQFAPEGDPRFFRSIRVRFAEPLFPGETIRTEMWKAADRIVFQVSVVERNLIALIGHVDFLRMAT